MMVQLDETGFVTVAEMILEAEEFVVAAAVAITEVV